MFFFKGTVREIYYRFKYGETIFPQKGWFIPFKIMDVLANHEAVIHIVVDRKGQIAGRRLQAAFFEKQGLLSADGP